MKLGCSSSSYNAAFANGRMDLREWLRVCAEDLELNGIELAERHFASTDPPYLREIKKLCVDLQLTISGIAVNSDFAPDDRRPYEAERVQQWCDVAAFIGAPIVRVFAGWMPAKRSEPQPGWLVGAFRKVFGEPPPNARRIWSDITSTLRQCADHAAERGVVLAVQNQRGSLAGTATQLAQLVHDVGSPWLRICLDPADLASSAGVDAVLPRVVQVHARVRNVRDDGSDSAIGWAELLRMLRLGNYRGFVHLDYDGPEAPESAVPRATNYIRGLLHLLDRRQLLQSPATEAASQPQNGAASATDIVREAFATEASARA